jgi:hypothetical protein
MTTDPQTSTIARSWRVEVIADSSGNWCGNACRYPDKKQAETAACDLMNRWLLVREWRVVESDEPANYELIEVSPGEFKMCPVKA